ncbi:response regulator transcription factor [soil metagenome]|jgi:DNA-binding NarL/FixJ family response regulator|uniref:response regulator n=1 Tax=unclassified Sphingobium TaxID=2611147 RepID=UPI001E3557BE|nr:MULTISPECIES: response regulator transcription factor [unclassified Sphingobium]GLI96428.1 DNA-binding response regulator [Sphingobium sp. BS19]CAH0355774.1 Transcriptional regulatory protein LnrK [Sphingobium sp. CECT 9361]
MIVMGRSSGGGTSYNAARLAAPHVVMPYKGRGEAMVLNSGGAEMERVLIIDDHPLVRDGLRSVIAVTFDQCEVFEAAGLEEAIATLEKQSNFDLILLDVHIPDVKRLDGLKLLRERFPILPVVMISGAFDRSIVREALAAGASGFIPKSMKRSAIVEALHRVVAGEIYMPDAIEEDSQGSQQETDILGRIASLTPQQRIVLTHLVHGRLNKQIAHDLSVSMTTVKAHVSAILQKLGVYSRTQAVIMANRVHFDGEN